MLLETILLQIRLLTLNLSIELFVEDAIYFEKIDTMIVSDVRKIA